MTEAKKTTVPDKPAKAPPMTEKEVAEKVMKGWSTPEGFEFVASDDMNDPDA